MITHPVLRKYWFGSKSKAGHESIHASRDRQRFNLILVSFSFRTKINNLNSPNKSKKLSIFYPFVKERNWLISAALTYKRRTISGVWSHDW